MIHLCDLPGITAPGVRIIAGRAVTGKDCVAVVQKIYIKHQIIAGH